MNVQTTLLCVAVAVSTWSVVLAVVVVHADIVARRSALRLLTRSLFAVLAARRSSEDRARIVDKGFGIQG